MRRWSFVLLIIALFATTTYAQDGTATLLIRVRDLEEQPVSALTFTVQVDGLAAQTVQSDASGAARIPNLVAPSIRVLSAQRADGTLLVLDENDRDGGLRIPLQTGLIQPLDLRLDDTRLFVEPVTLTRALSDTDLAREEAAVTATASQTTRESDTPAPIPAASSDPLGPMLRWSIFLVIAVPIGLMVFVWLRRSINRHLQPQRRNP